jgi:hypothetical protein
MSTRNAVAGLTAVFVAAGVAGCGTPASRPVSEAPAVTASTTTAPPVTSGSGDCHPTAGAAREILIAGPFAACAVQLSQGQLLHIELPPVARSDGTVAQYSMPRSNMGRVMSPAAGRGPCPTEDTCATFLATAVGRAVISWIAPGGCAGGGPCVMARVYEVRVAVLAG